MNIGVIGGVARNDEIFIFGVLANFVKPEDTIISGGAEGVDSIARMFAKAYNLELIEYLPENVKEIPYGSSAFKERNKQIADKSDIIIAFPSVSSRGTWFTVGEARKRNKRIVVFEETKK